MLLEGANEYDIIEELIIIDEQTTKSFQDYMLRDTRPLIMNH